MRWKNKLTKITWPFMLVSTHEKTTQQLVSITNQRVRQLMASQTKEYTTLYRKYVSLQSQHNKLDKVLRDLGAGL